MSYYMGDYYRGDPFWGAVASLVGKGISWGKQAIGRLAGGHPGGGVMPGGMPMMKGRPGEIIQAAKGAIIKHPVLSGAGAAGAIAGLGAGAEHMLGARGACPRGFHISKSKHAKHFGQCVRNRRMKVTNPRALKRALRRAYGFERIAMRTIHLLHPKKRARFGGFKKRRKS